MQRCTKLYRIDWELWEPVSDLPKIGNTVKSRVYVWDFGYWERLKVEVRVNIKKKGTSEKKMKSALITSEKLPTPKNTPKRSIDFFGRDQ
jgi:hypothetical protein